MLSSNISFRCPHNVANFGPLTAEIDPVVWGTPANFNRFCVLAALLHGTLASASANFAVLNRGRHLYSAGRPSHWPLAHISSYYYSVPQHRNARIASTVLATVIPSVCPSIRLSHAGIVSKRWHVARCSLHSQIAKYVWFCRSQKIFPRVVLFLLKSCLQVTYPLLIAASLDMFCLVAPQR